MKIRRHPHPLPKRRSIWPSAQFGLIVLAVIAAIGTFPSVRQLFQKLGFAPVAILEKRFSRPDLPVPEIYTGIIVLSDTLPRVKEAARLARTYSHFKVILTGQHASRYRGWLGPKIAVHRVLVEDKAHNTYQNGLYTAELIKSNSLKGRWLLVTSASHMPRSIGVFRKLGIAVSPWPAYDSNDEVIRSWTIAAHEWLGLIFYWIMGRTNDVFPSPSGP